MGMSTNFSFSMSHTKYHTDAIILGGANTGEADKFIQMLTHDFGLVGVHARGVRKAASKQKSYLQNLTLAHVSLVRGRNIWRLTHVQEGREALLLSQSEALRNAAARIVHLLRRFIRGEEAHPELFSSVRKGLLYMSENHSSRKNVQHIESLIALRILFFLGYVAPGESLSRILEAGDTYSDEIIRKVEVGSELVNTLLYQAIEESGL